MLVENELKKFKKFDLSYFKGKSFFEGNDGAQNTLVFQTIQKQFNLSNENQINKWKSKGLSNQYFNLAGIVCDIILSRTIKPMHVIFRGKSLLYQKNNDVITDGPIINIYIVYKTSPKTISSSFVLKNSLFGAVKTTNITNSDPDKWQYSGCGIRFDSKGEFTHPDRGGYGKSAIIFGGDLSNSRYANNKTKHVLVLGKDSLQKIKDTTIYGRKNVFT